MAMTNASILTACIWLCILCAGWFYGIGAAVLCGGAGFLGAWRTLCEGLDE